MTTMNVLDAAGNVVAINIPNADGPLASANSRSVVLASDHAPVPIVAPSPIDVVASNIKTKFRDAFEDPSLANWTRTTGTGDIVQTDGNAASASYLMISKSPWDAGNQTTLETIDTFGMPLELAYGASRSQATLGQEFSVEIVDTQTPLAAVADIAISSITQTTTILTVDTSADHGLVPGQSIGIVGCSNQLANYPALVVASTPTPRQFTCTAGPGGTIPSQTITNPVGAKGSVFARERLGRAQNGVSQIFENATITNASFYLRSESGDVLPSGTILGNHAITVATAASVQLVNSPYAYAFSPTSEYRFNLQADRVQTADSPVDSLVQAVGRVLRTQVCPDPSVNYRLRIRANNSKSLTVLTAKVVSVVKTGTTTGTFTTATAHGLTTGDLIVYYGNSNTAAAAFPNVVAATAVTVVDATTFTMVIGTASTVTGYGGVIAKVQGGNLLSALGVINNSGVNVTLSTLTNGTRQLVITGAAAWAGLLIGDYVNAEGITNVTNGATLGVDGVWKVANSATTALTLVPGTAAFAATLPADFALTNSAGAVIKRSCFRMSFVRIFDYERQRVEVLARPTGDISGAAPVAVQNVPAVTVSSGTITAVTGITNALPAGANTIGAANLALMASVADVASAAITTTATVAAVTPGFGISYQVNIPVTVVSGTNPTLDVRIEESDDAGTNWFTVYDFPRITATGIYRSPFLPVTGNRIRYVQTIGGTTPSFTRAINRLQSNAPFPNTRQLIDRSIAPNTGNSTTPVLLARDCGNATQLVVNMGAITTTAPAFQLEGSDDFGATWYAIGSPLTGVASSTVQVTVPDVNAAALRARVSTAGSGATLGYVLIKAHD
jgi:hypothetical protein